MSIPKIAVGNPVLANLLMIAVIVFGTYAWFALPRELSPEVTLQTATVMTFYPGASPEEVEKLITVPIEDAIEEGVGKIDLMVSTSTEGRSVITIQFEEISDRDFDKQMQNLRSSVERVGDLPDDLPDDPRVQEVDISDGFPMLTVVVAGKRSETELKKIAEDLRDEILDIRNIASVRLAGVREREVWVELDPDRLAAYGLSSLDVMTALRADNLNLPAGTMGIGKSEFIVRTLGEYRSLAEIEDTIIRTARAGSPLRIRDIASVSDTFEKPRTLSRVDGEPSISMTIQKKKEGNTIALVKELRELVAERQPQMPDGVALSAVNDYSVILKERLGILQSNAGFGMVLVIAMLFALLGWRNAFFAAIGIPVAFMATFWFMHVTGYSLSGVALFGLILVVGIVVDDAIVVIENVARHLQMGKSPAQAAIDGAEEVWLPVLAASLTTIGAFGPLMFMSGVPGQFMRIVPIVAILVLVASLMESFFILPAHIAEWGKGASGTERRTVWFEKIQWTYVRTLKRILRRRYLAVPLVFLVGILGSVLAFMTLEVELFPGEDFPQFYIKTQMPSSYSLQQTSDVLASIEKEVLSLSSSELAAVVTNVGLSTPVSGMESATVSTNVGVLLVELVPKDQRTRTVDEIIRDLRGRVSATTGVEKLTFEKLEGG
ncbi:MAG: efflux RND transporter permease subunit, partial [Candidatus Poribacteria bacterium]|nr:efflux RND transporter permease subunit [Candidatus Poribacteria bacterium]